MPERDTAESLPELLGLLAYELEATLARLLPAWPAAELEQFALELTQVCRVTIGGHRLLAAPHLSASELRADAAYGVLHDAWRPLVLTRASMPAAWADVAVLHLIDTLRRVAGGAYLPKSRYSLTEPDVAEMFRSFRGSFRDTGLRYGLSAERVRQLLVPLIKADRASRQPDLFGED